MAADPENSLSVQNVLRNTPTLKGSAVKPMKPARRSLVAGQSRKDRFAARRPGTGRNTTAREVSLNVKPVPKDAQGFDDLDAVFGESSSDEFSETEISEDDDGQSVAGPVFSDVGNESFMTAGGATPASAAPSSARRSPRMSSARKPASVSGRTPAAAASESGTPLAQQSVARRRAKQLREMFKGSPARAQSPMAVPSFDAPPPGAMTDESAPESSPSSERDRKVPTPARASPAAVRASAASGDDDADDEAKVEAAQKRQKAPKQPKNKGDVIGMKRPRRNTFGIIEEARESGLLSQLSGQDANGTRRSSRLRFLPLQYWKNEHLNYRRSDQGVGVFLPTIDEEKPIVRDVPPTPPQRPRKRRLVAKRVKRSEDSDDEDGEAKETERVDVDPVATVRDFSRGGVKMDMKVVRQRHKVALTPLHQVEPDGEVLAAEFCPYGARLFDRPNFNSGSLLLPPSGRKVTEINKAACEIFFVHSCAVNGLQVNMGRKSFVLSKGDSFFIPRDNEYSIVNLSDKKKVRLHFVVVPALTV